MIESKQHKLPRGRSERLERTEVLPFKIAIWNPARDEVDRVLARAANATLARAIFKAACEEHPDRHVVFQQGGRVLDERREQQPD